MDAPELPRTTWIPGVGPRPDDAWARAIDKELRVDVGCMLFERGQGFEAHEVWEFAWKDAKAAGRADDERVLRAMIKVAAAMVKVRQGNPIGVRGHAKGARLVLDDVRGDVVLGVDVTALKAMARAVEDNVDAWVNKPVGEPMFGKIPRA